MPEQSRFYIVTGISGAGKSQALKILEDFGFFCVDNLPLSLVPEFAALCQRSDKKKLSRAVLGLDTRAGMTLGSLERVRETIRARGLAPRVLFFTADDATLLKRYSETRRRHPLAARAIDGIRRERTLLSTVLSLADQVIDTSYLTLGELKEVLARELHIAGASSLTVNVESFGYKRGIPIDADLVMDVRFLPNPNYIHTLRTRTGTDSAVRRYVVRQKLYASFFRRFSSLVKFLVPRYISEGKSHLTIAVGCTGGRHRSVVVAEALARFLQANGYQAGVHHRDIAREP